jgi:phage gpG-like protein
MSAVPVTFSKRAQALFNAGKFDEKLAEINTDAAKYILGTHVQNRGTLNAPMKKGFTRWTSARSNSRTKWYESYKDWYAEKKFDAGRENWHIVDGHLLIDAIYRAKILSDAKHIRIMVNKGKSSDYAATQQYGNVKMNVPPRPFYAMDKNDMKYLSTFYQNRLAQAFGVDARFGKIRR